MSGERALALGLELDTGHERTVFLDWPDAGGDLDQLVALLERAGVSVRSFADLYGSRVPVEVVGDFLVVPVDVENPDERSERRTSREGPRADGDTGFEPTSAIALVGVAFAVWLGFYAWTYGRVSEMGWPVTLAWLADVILLGLFVDLDTDWMERDTEMEPSSRWPWYAMALPPVFVPFYAIVRYARGRDTS